MQSGALVGQSLWSVLATSTLRHISILEYGRLPVFSTAQMVKATLCSWNMELHATLQKKIKEWQDRNMIKRLPWPSQSLEINPIEHFWPILDRAVRKKSRKPTSWAELLTRLREASAEIPQEKISELVSSMPERVKAMKSANGKYNILVHV